VSIVVKHRRGTSAEIAGYTLAVGEIIYNTDDNSLHVGDGLTAGGHKQTIDPTPTAIPKVDAAITASGITPDSGNNDQLAQAIANAGSHFYEDTGGVNTYALDPVAPRETPTEYYVGMPIKFFAANANNGGSVTVEIGSLGPIPVKLDGNLTPAANDISGRTELEVRADAPLTAYVLNPASLVPSETAPVTPFIDGIIPENSTGDVAHDIVFGAGTCTDSTLTKILTVTSPLTKRMDDPWVEGDLNGGMAQGSAGLSADAPFYMFIIGKVGDTTVDFVCDDNIDGTNVLADPNVLIAGYTLLRRVGSFVTDATDNIRKFYYDTDGYTQFVEPFELFTGSTSTAVSGDPVNTPLPPDMRGRFLVTMSTGNDATYTYVMLGIPTDLASVTPSSTARHHIAGYGFSNAETVSNSVIDARVSNTGIIAHKAQAVRSTLGISLIGYTDTRR
jgi:hypothetical protein